MNFGRKIGMIISLAAILASTDAYAQNLQSVSNYTSRHDELLARQTNIGEQIRIEETEQYAKALEKYLETRRLSVILDACPAPRSSTQFPHSAIKLS